MNDAQRLKALEDKVERLEALIPSEKFAEYEEWEKSVFIEEKRTAAENGTSWLVAAEVKAFDERWKAKADADAEEMRRAKEARGA